MSEIIQKILEWPVIVQGALGSGLFWLILLVGQKLTSITMDRLSKLSRSRQLSALREERLKYSITLPNNNDRAAMLAILIYRASRHISFALIWLTLGLASQAFIPTFGLIGYIGALFYLFNAVRTFRPIDTKVDKPEKIKAIDAEIEKLAKHNKPTQPTADAAAD